ncbi:Orf3 [Torque teno zalophus virus 1]|uniref:Orf3 n=1 Tax=Torque teno zalophus virus 1 TaxID=1218490 RepID=C0JSK9_ZCTTV|nr:Orf3 [Torque teno zalophus virus 1]ACN38867.1 Orf3 [Torque teno zalophus virus 1]
METIAHSGSNTVMSLRSLETVNTEKLQVQTSHKWSQQHQDHGTQREIAHKYNLVPYSKNQEKDHLTQQTSSSETQMTGSSRRQALRELVDLVQKTSYAEWKTLHQNEFDSDSQMSYESTSTESSISLISYPDEGGETPPYTPPVEEGAFTSPFLPVDCSTQI